MSPTKRISPYIPTMCALMIVKTSRLVMVAADRHVAAQVHDADHHGEARHGADAARSARPAGGRSPRSGAAGAAAAAANRTCAPIVFGSGRTPSEIASPATMNTPEESHGTTRSSGVSSRPENIGPKTSGPKIARRHGAEQHERDAAGAPLGREHLCRGGARQQHDRARRACQREAEDDERARFHGAAEGGRHAADDADREAAADHGHPSEAIGRAARPGRPRARRRRGRSPARARGCPRSRSPRRESPCRERRRAAAWRSAPRAPREQDRVTSDRVDPSGRRHVAATVVRPGRRLGAEASRRSPARTGRRSAGRRAASGRAA